METTVRYERVALDHYETEEWVTRVLMRHVDLKRVWEPAVGKGKMAKELSRIVGDVRGTDVHDYGFGYSVMNFMDAFDDWDGDIVTNPPFDIADLFIDRALRLTKQHRGKVAMLLRNEFDCAAARRNVFDHPFAMKIVLLKRPRWIDGSTGSPRHNYAWYVWDWNYDGKPVLVYDK